MNQSKNNDKTANINNKAVNKDEDQNTSSVISEDNKKNETSLNDEENTHDEGNFDVSVDNKDEIQNEVKDLKDQLLRALAENENLRKRTSKEIEQIKKYGHIGLIRDFLNIVDNLDRAVKSSAQDTQSKMDTKNLMDGIEIVLKEMNSLLEKNQIKKIEPLHEKFDYNFHQAMFEAPSSDYDEGIIVEVVQPGYILLDRLIRPAMVGVSKGQTKEKEENEEKNE